MAIPEESFICAYCDRAATEKCDECLRQKATTPLCDHHTTVRLKEKIEVALCPACEEERYSLGGLDI